MTSLPYWNHNAAYYPWIARMTEHCTSVLDVGCGDGTLARYLGRDGRSVTGIDPSDAGIEFWMTFLNGVGSRELSRDHAVHSAEIFSRCRPKVVGTGGLVLFPGTPLLEEANRGEFSPLSEREMLTELKTFVEGLTCDCTFITHHTVSGRNLTGPDFLARKAKIVAALEDEIRHGDLDGIAAVRRSKRTL